MKVRTITLGISIEGSDFDGDAAVLRKKIVNAETILSDLSQLFLDELAFEVQTTRLVFNSFEYWMPSCRHEEFLKVLVDIARDSPITMFNLGQCSCREFLALVPSLLSMSDKFCTSVQFPRINDDAIAPNIEMCREAAQIIKQVSTLAPGDGSRNFNFCAGFHCPTNIPYFPTSYHTTSAPNGISLGFENADLLFMAFHGVSSELSTYADTARQNLISTMTQVYEPVQDLVQKYCDSYVTPMEYLGIDASINPGLTLPIDSVGAGMENLFPHRFGDFGTLTTVSIITSAIKALAKQKRPIKLVGYNGLMLPVMEDNILSQRAGEKKNEMENSYTVRDLLLFSSVCGVGLDTVPIPGDVSVESLTGVLMETGTMAYRLNKPLSVRLFPIPGKVAGEMTDMMSSNAHVVDTAILPLT